MTCSNTVCKKGFSASVSLSLSWCQTRTWLSSTAVAVIWNIKRIISAGFLFSYHSSLLTWKYSSAATPNHSGESTKLCLGTKWSILPFWLTRNLIFRLREKGKRFREGKKRLSPSLGSRFSPPTQNNWQCTDSGDLFGDKVTVLLHRLNPSHGIQDFGKHLAVQSERKEQLAVKLLQKGHH